MAAKRRTKKDLARAEERRIKAVKQKISKNESHKSKSNKFLDSNQLPSSQVVIKNSGPKTPQLYAQIFGYSFDLIKQDLFKTIISTLFVGALLLLIYLFN